jgi:hypothetical protein
MDARYATVNIFAGDQLIMNTMMNTTVNREFPQQKLHWIHFLMPKALLGTRTSYA